MERNYNSYNSGGGGNGSSGGTSYDVNAERELLEYMQQQYEAKQHMLHHMHHPAHSHHAQLDSLASLTGMKSNNSSNGYYTANKPLVYPNLAACLYPERATSPVMGSPMAPPPSAQQQSMAPSYSMDRLDTNYLPFKSSYNPSPAPMSSRSQYVTPYLDYSMPPSSALMNPMQSLASLMSPTPKMMDKIPQGITDPLQSVLFTDRDELVKSSEATIIYRNLFHTFHCKLSTEWESYRIYVSDAVGYSGNAKRFKRKPEKGERALLMECSLLDMKDQPVTQCLICKDYFATQKYFKANPHCVEKVVLVKNNTPICVENGQFSILVKIMCCCVHHNAPNFQLAITLRNPETEDVVMNTKVMVYVKQWRKSTQKKEECDVIFQ